MPGHAFDSRFALEVTEGGACTCCWTAGGETRTRLRGDFVSRRRGRTVQINPHSDYN